MIVPETLDITVDYNMQKNIDGEWDIDGVSMAVNGRTAKDSKILLDLLIDFVCPPEDEMTIDKLCNDFGNIVILALDVFGDVNVVKNVEGTNLSGIIISI